MSNRRSNGTALITGTSSGIGAVYADRLAKRGCNLILVARNEARLKVLSARLAKETKRSVTPLRADLSDKADLMKVERLLRDDEAITMLVNNAVIGARSIGESWFQDLPNRDGDLDIDISLDRIRVGTDGVGALDKLSRRFLVDPSDGHGERGGKHERARVVAAEADLGDNFDVAIGEMTASLAADAQERILKTRGIAAGEELLWVGRIAFTSEASGQGQLKI